MAGVPAGSDAFAYLEPSSGPGLIVWVSDWDTVNDADEFAAAAGRAPAPTGESLWQVDRPSPTRVTLIRGALKESVRKEVANALANALAQERPGSTIDLQALGIGYADLPRAPDQAELMQLVRTEVLIHAPVGTRVAAQPVNDFSLGGQNAMVMYLVSGPDLDKLEVIGKNVLEKMKGVPGVVDLDSSLLDPVEETTVKVLAEVKPGRDLYANVELYAAIILHAVDVPPQLFTPMFAVGRTAGWTAHMIEQLAETKITRPESVYVGPYDLRWQPMAERR